MFLFAAGGVAAVCYNVLTRQPIAATAAPAKRPKRRQGYNIGLAAPALVFPVALVALRTPIRAGVVALVIGCVARGACRPDLLAKMVVGGLLFFAIYALLLGP